MACASDCQANQVCVGNAPTCSNSYSFSSLSSNGIIYASHLRQLQLAIDSEITDVSRHYVSAICPLNTFVSWGFTAPTANVTIVNANDLNDVAAAYNNAHANINFYYTILGTQVWTKTFLGLLQEVIYASDWTSLQTYINQMRNLCICDSYCSCNIDCGCNGECSDDGYYYYP